MVFLFRAMLFLFAVFMYAAPAHAEKPLIFLSEAADIRTRQIESFLIENGTLSADAAMQTAKIDLNNDGIDEVVFRQMTEGCAATANCLYVIGGLSARQPAHIATIRARKIGISSENAYGVRNVLVYNEKRNDFQYITYVWDPAASTFKGQ